MKHVLRLGNGDGDANLQVNVGSGWCFVRYMQRCVASPAALRGSTVKPEAVDTIHGAGFSAYNVYRIAP